MKILIQVILFAISINGYASNQSEWKEITKIKHKANAMTTDKLGNIYLSNENHIWLYNKKGDSIGEFNSRKYGSISHIDATDPYKILVFFADYNLIVFLDNYLSVNGDPIDLQELGFDQVSMACRSRAAGFWIYDLIKQKAIHLDDNFKSTKQTVNLSQWFSKRINPTSMIEYNNTLYINESESGIYVFDHFATYQKKIPLLGLQDFQLMEDGIRYFKDDSFCDYIFRDFSEKCEKLELKGASNLRMEKNNFFVFKAEEAIIYLAN